MAIASVNSTFQPAWQQLQLRQAQQGVDQAEQRARNLQAQASSAQLAADRAQAEAKTLSSQASQALSAAAQAQLQLQTVNSLNQLGSQINNTLGQVLPKPPVSTLAPAATPAPVVAVTNTQGQTVGSVVNTTA